MKVYQLRQTQVLPISLDEAWDFFSTPTNLNKITPPDLSFNILNENELGAMYEGMIIRYKIQLLPVIPFDWTTEITHVEDHKYFVDEQRFGPYALWHHQHHFEEHPDGVLMTDIVHYAVPFGIIGRIAKSLYVGNKVKQIFEYRKEMLSDYFSR